MNVSQRSVFGSNTTEVHTASPALTILALGGAGAMVAFAVVLGTLVGGAAAFAIVILASTCAGVLALGAVTRSGLQIAHWRATRQLPPTRPLLTINRPLQLPEPR